MAARLLVCLLLVALATAARPVIQDARMDVIDSSEPLFELEEQKAASEDVRPGHKWEQFMLSPEEVALRKQELLTAGGAAELISLAVEQGVGSTNELDGKVMPTFPEGKGVGDDLPFNFDVASLLARYTAIAYCDPLAILAWNCSRCGHTAIGFEVTMLDYDIRWDLLAFAGWSKALNAAVVSFRGTDSHSLYNWVENMRYWRSDFHLPFPGAEGAKVHTGFFQSYNDSTLATNVTEAVRQLAVAYPGAPLYVTGHSMGSAMATVATLYLKFSLNLTDVRLYTFGSPRVGNDVFAEFFRSQITESWRFTHDRDIVPSVPLQIMGFHHVATEVWIVDFKGSPLLLNLCDGSGEDPLCHNSVCYLGLCTSLEDHFNYLDVRFGHPDGGC